MVKENLLKKVGQFIRLTEEQQLELRKHTSYINGLINKIENKRKLDFSRFDAETMEVALEDIKRFSDLQKKHSLAWVRRRGRVLGDLFVNVLTYCLSISRRKGNERQHLGLWLRNNGSDHNSTVRHCFAFRELDLPRSFHFDPVSSHLLFEGWEFRGWLSRE